MNKIKKGITALLHPFKYYKLSNRLSNELNVTKQELLLSNKNLATEKEKLSNLKKELESEKRLTSTLSIKIEKEMANSIYYVVPKPILGKDLNRHNKTKKQVLVVGYYGATNYGDELMLKSILNNADAANEYSVIFAPNYRYNFSQWPNCFAYSHPNSIEDYPKIAEFYDELIIGGGAHIDDNDCKFPGFIPFLGMELSLLFLSRGKKIRWLGVSSNKELHSTEYISTLKRIIDGATEFSVRDPYTLDLLKNKCGLNNSKIKLIDDLALNIKPKKIIGVTLIDFYNNKAQNVLLIREIISFVKQSNYDYRICFITFFNEWHHDKKMYENLIEEIDFDEVEYFIASEYDTVENMYLVISGCDLFVNMRYHASLLSLSYGKPTISICYDIHPHYYNKMTYINEKYKNPYILNYSNYKNGQLLEKLNEILKGK